MQKCTLSLRKIHVRQYEVLMRGVLIGKLYKLLGRTNTNGCVNTVIPKANKISSCLIDSTMIWHQQMGHISEKGLHAMHSKVMVRGLPNCSYEVDLYEHCVYGKQNHVSFQSGAIGDKGILELIHSDVFGLVLVPSIGGS